MSGRLLVTGAAGFLGCAVVAEARAAGAEVVALVRPGGAESGVATGLADLAIADPGVTVLALDLAAPGAAEALARALPGVTAVIHVAARLSGDADAHRRDTVEATAALLTALKGRDARLVLAGSIAVHDMAALPEGALLDATAPLSDGAGRDAYARAKLAQEALVRQAAGRDGLACVVLRLGVLYGPGRLWTSHLGFGLGPLILCPGGDIPVPALHVEDAARALFRAATCPEALLYDAQDHLGAGRLATAVLVAADPPSQRAWLRALGARRVIRFPVGLVGAAARLGDGLAALGLGAGLPGVLRSSAFAARFRRLRYTPAIQGPGLVRRLGLSLRPFPSSFPPNRSEKRS